MDRKFHILLLTFILALVNFNYSDSKDLEVLSPSERTEQICADQLVDASPFASEYAIARNNTYSANARNLSSYQKKNSSSHAHRHLIKYARQLNIENSLKSTLYISHYYPTTYHPQRIIIQLCKLII